MSKSSRKIHLELLSRMNVDYTTKISAERAAKKLTRAIEKKGMPDDILEVEKEVIEELGFEVPDNLLLKNKKKDKKSKKKEKKSKKGKKVEKEKKPKKSKKGSNINAMKRLLEEGASKKKIQNFFVERYEEKGVSDLEFIEKRITIYTKIAQG